MRDAGSYEQLERKTVRLLPSWRHRWGNTLSTKALRQFLRGWRNCGVVVDASIHFHPAVHRVLRRRCHCSVCPGDIHVDVLRRSIGLAHSRRLFGWCTNSLIPVRLSWIARLVYLADPRRFRWTARLAHWVHRHVIRFLK